MMTGQIEYRQLKEFRFDVSDDEVVIRGIAVPYENEIDYGGWFRESFAKRAFADGIDERVVLLANHQGLPYARTGAETLTFREKSDGLHFEAVLDTRDPDAMGLKVKIERKDLDGVSVGFQAKEQRWLRGEGDELDHRIIVRAELQEISVTPIPAYVDTNVEMAREDFKVALECRSKWQSELNASDGNDTKRVSVMPLDFELH